MKNLKLVLFNLSLVAFLMNSSCEQEEIIKHQIDTTNTGKYLYHLESWKYIIRSYNPTYL